jgi:hypothetical protein
VGYDLRALIARRDVLAAHKQDFGSVHVVGLRQGFALIPLTEQLVAEICGGDAPRDDRPLTSGEELPWQLTSWIHFIS